MSSTFLPQTAAGDGAPYVYRRRVRFADSDAAQIIYTVRLFDYAMEALEGWFDQVADHDWYRINTERGVGTPFVRVEMDIRSALRPGDFVSMIVLIVGTGRSSIRFSVVGHRESDGALAFESIWVCAVIDKNTMKSIPLPMDLRRRIKRYRQHCEEAKS